MNRSVIKEAHRSPMNPKQWLLTLDCGHEGWATRSRAPLLGAKVECSKCEKPDVKGAKT